MTKGLLPYAVGVLLLGLIGLTVGEFALQWQPVPKAVPYRAALVYVSATLLAASGLAMLIRRTSVPASLLAGCQFALWAAILHLPRVIGTPEVLARWNGLAEILALAAGGVAGWALLRNTAADQTVARIARRVLGGCAVVFGLSHFVYADFTATMVPGWIPVPLFWAYATGVGHLAAGLSLITGIRARLAASLFAAMVASFLVFVHVPRVVSSPGSHIEWVMLAIALSLTGAVWNIRSGLASSSSSRRRAFSVFSAQ